MAQVETDRRRLAQHAPVAQEVDVTDQRLIVRSPLRIHAVEAEAVAADRNGVARRHLHVLLGLVAIDQRDADDEDREQIGREFGEQSRRKVKKALLDALDGKYSFELPPTLVEQEFAAVWSQVEADMKNANKTFADENTTEDDINEFCLALPRYKRPRKVMDTISDNAANVGIILGGRPIKPMDIDLRWASALLYKNGVIEETGVAAGVLNHPANGIAWLSKKFAPHQVPLLPGQIILAGSFTRPVKVKAGDTVHVDYGPLGNISARFV